VQAAVQRLCELHASCFYAGFRMENSEIDTGFTQMIRWYSTCVLWPQRWHSLSIPQTHATYQPSCKTTRPFHNFTICSFDPSFHFETRCWAQHKRRYTLRVSTNGEMRRNRFSTDFVRNADGGLKAMSLSQACDAVSLFLQPKVVGS